MYRFLAALWGVLSAGILLFGFVAGARSRHITMNGPVHILLEEEEAQTPKDVLIRQILEEYMA